MEGAVAQSVEQRTENPCVGGSIPPHTTTASSNDGVFFMYVCRCDIRPGGKGLKIPA